MAYSAFTRKNCETDYVYNNLTFTQLAKKYGCSEGTLSGWSKRYHWQQKKEQHSTTARSGILAAHNALSKLSQRLDGLDPEDVKFPEILKSMRSIILSLKRLEKLEDRKGDAINMMNSFCDFINARCQDQKFLDMLHDYTEGWFEVISNQ
ncbi:MAG: hypothetical protein ACE5IR_27310 [bacterium]